MGFSIHLLEHTARSRSCSLPDEIFLQVFEHLLADRKQGRQSPICQIGLKRQKLAPIFVRLSCISKRFRRLAIGPLYRELTATELLDPRLSACLQAGSNSLFTSSEPGGHVRSASVCWTLMGGSGIGESIPTVRAIELSKFKARLFTTLSNLNYFRNLTRLDITLDSGDFSSRLERLLPDISHFSVLPFLQGLRHFSLSNGRSARQSEDDLDQNISTEDLRVLGEVIKRLPDLHSLNLTGYDFCDLDLRIEEGQQSETRWSAFQQLKIWEMSRASTSLANASFYHFYTATSNTLRSIFITCQFASAKIAPIIAQQCCPHLESLSLLEGNPYAQDFSLPLAHYDWSSFFPAIPNCRTLAIDFTSRHTQSSWEDFLSALHSSPATNPYITSIQLGIMAPDAEIDPIAALDALAAILPLSTFPALERLDFASHHPDPDQLRITAERFITANQALPTIHHVMIYKTLKLMNIAYSPKADFTVCLTSVAPTFSPWIFEAIRLDARKQGITIESSTNRHTLIDLLLTPPICAVIDSLEEQGWSVRWNV